MVDPITGINLALAAIDALISTAFKIYNMISQIKGTVKIPTWDEIIEKNKKLAEKINAELVEEKPPA